MAREEPRHANIPAAVLNAVPAPADIMLTGSVDDLMVRSFLEQLAKAKDKPGDLVVCCTTTGGDAELVDRIVLELERLEEQRSVYYLGKSVVYSAGVTIMSAFPVDRRFLTRGTRLLIHGRQLTRTVQLDGPVRALAPLVEGLLRQIEFGMAIEQNGFERLIRGSRVELADLLERAKANWYVEADEAERLGLVAALV